MICDVGTCYVLMFTDFMIAEVFATEPSFDVPTINVTVVEGEDATLPCSVENLQEHTVVWTDQWTTILTYGTTRILDDDRISVERPYTEDWNLLIREVKYEDKGKYICQINTKPVKAKYVELYVLVPPKVISSTRDVITREGETVTLACNVTGIPPPRVQWYRQPLGQSPGKQKEQIGAHGEILIIHNVSRYCEVRPEIELPNKRIGQYQGKDTILECKITAFPQAVTVWKRFGKEITSNFKYHVEVYDLGSHRLTLSLRIKNIDTNDFGSYACFSSNKLGEDQEEMILYVQYICKYVFEIFYFLSSFLIRTCKKIRQIPLFLYTRLYTMTFTQHFSLRKYSTSVNSLYIEISEYFQRTTGRPTFRTESYPIKTQRLPDNQYSHGTKITGSIQGPLIVTKGTKSSLESK
ncbi:hypothetical protein KUTeg_018323 [Tegillarca granosa]|uniref:Ig-like domain-containing protein n=1 Tax=Tegillarca granosa TaxID=220873 RepID=A0ABQ9EMW5_TEGGR|nr:hypothetical protein KUTeg_018323 [Tegillarca granosa]